MTVDLSVVYTTGVYMTGVCMDDCGPVCGLYDWGVYDWGLYDCSDMQ